ncbi:hypothetical protein [Stenotrophomonas maltophilia]|uniref:hypothetical protein n=1 Tax=Stenotrophomonas maltophilia TaxID=40324 RepID=UPI0015DE9AB2|nr:hypothetical protein [Stenotrophomonas maltophilia]MBA0286854.1 hypothetical protein [Stenotrophomonas maltophilia]MBA0322669.1 hypothetical protein [Stenotrophomonas maltophilia]
MNIEIEKYDEFISVIAPYNAAFIAQAKRIGGKWDGGDKSWNFDIKLEEKVRALCLQFYGTDGLKVDLCIIEVDLPADKEQWQGPLTLAGRVLASARGRDTGAVLGNGVSVLKGCFTSGGSRQNWTTAVGPNGVTALIRDFPRAAAEALIAKGEIPVRIVEDAKNDRNNLVSEKERLLARLAEIEELLQEEEAA